MKILSFLILIAQVLPTKGQVIRRPSLLTYPGLSAYSKNFVDIFSAFSNQASLASVKTGALGVSGERRFMLQELSAYSSLIAVPFKSGTIGLQVDYFGSAYFNQSQIGLMYGRKINSIIDLGVKFNYNLLRLPGYGTASAINLEAGAIIHLNEKLHTGIHIYNPVKNKIGKTGFEKFKSVYRMGFGYEVSEQLLAGCEIVKNEDQRVAVNAGLQYNLDQRFFLRLGLAAGNNNNYGSAGLNVGFGRIDVNIAYHPQLGFTPGALLLIYLKKPVQE